MPKPSINVLAAVIMRDGRYLICKRPSHKRHGGLWEFPGGKLEAAETWEMAAERELAEELALAVRKVGEPLLAIHDVGSPFTIVFVPVTTVGDPQVLEHEEIAWVSASQLLEFDLAPSDRRFVQWLNDRDEHLGEGH